MSREIYDDSHDEEIVMRLRRRAEIAALEKGLQMLEDPATSSTARASIIRGFLGDATTRRHDPDRGDKPLHEMSQAELQAEIRASARRLALLRAEPIDVEFEELPPDVGVFK